MHVKHTDLMGTAALQAGHAAKILDTTREQIAPKTGAWFDNLALVRAKLVQSLVEVEAALTFSYPEDEDLDGWIEQKTAAVRQTLTIA